MTKILLCQLNSNGDCLLATTIARQIKTTYPGSFLTWAIGDCCKKILEGNEYIDEVYIVPLEKITEANVTKAWKQLCEFAKEQVHSGVYQHVFYTQYSYGHFENYMGITRASIFEGYPHPITVPVKPVLRLSSEEVNKVQSFVDKHDFRRYRKVILFEFAAHSGQSFIDEDFVQQFCQAYTSEHSNDLIVLSSARRFETGSPNVINANELTFRENAELFNHCHLFLGCSSGITWMSLCDGIREVPKIILIDESCPQASMILDHKYFGLSIDNIIELKKCTPDQVIDVIRTTESGKMVPEQLKAAFSFDEIVFIRPFDFHFEKKNFKKLMVLFRRANLKMKRTLTARMMRIIKARLISAGIKKRTAF